MREKRLGSFVPILMAMLLAAGTLAQETPEITVEAILHDGSVVTLPRICETQVLEIMRSIGAPSNDLGVPIVPRDVTLRITGEGLTSQRLQSGFDFGALDFNRMDDGQVDHDLVPQVALDPAVAGAQRVRFDAPLRGQLLAMMDRESGEHCINAAILEGSMPLRADILAQLEAELAGMQTDQEVPSSEGPEGDIRGRLSRVRADMRAVAVALESYYVDCNAYPAWIGGASEHSVSRGNSPLTAMPAFRRYEMGGPMTITTPIAYLTGYPRDPFNGEGGLNTFSYFSDERGWILVSPGPDGEFDITPTLNYNSKIPQPSTDLVRLAYDPTNGTISSGDIYRVR